MASEPPVTPAPKPLEVEVTEADLAAAQRARRILYLLMLAGILLPPLLFFVLNQAP
jgi:hypothetical protein